MSSSRRNRNYFSNPHPARTPYDIGPLNYNEDHLDTWLSSLDAQDLHDFVPEPSRDDAGPEPAAYQRDFTMPSSQRDVSAHVAGVHRSVPEWREYFESLRAPRGVPGAYPMAPPPLPVSVPSMMTVPPLARRDRDTPPPAYSMETTRLSYEPSKPKARVPLPKRGLDADNEKEGRVGEPRISRFQFESARLTGAEAERRMNMQAEREKESEQAREALRLRDEGRREAERIRIERERKSKSEQLARLVKEAEEYADKVARSVMEQEGQEKQVEDVNRALGELSIRGDDGNEDEDEDQNGCQEEDDWEVVEGPNVRSVMVDECVDSDDSDTWC